MKAEFLSKIVVYATLASLSIGAATGCGPARKAYDELYAELREEPGVLDQSVLAGRRVVIDPGHGGYFDGVVGGVDSLAEADVNLGVALHLWGLLSEAGADVVLTRSTDRDFLPEGSSELRDDLEARMAVVNEFAPEAFISIHHNAVLPLDREANRVEVYYRSDDTEASLALASDIRLHLARNLGIEETGIKPGEYFVLRNSISGAAVLGEASYLSHPVVEQRLKLASKQRMEAEAYFLGLISYFSRGVPSIERMAPARDTVTAPEEIVFAVKRSNGSTLDISSAKIMIGGREVGSHFDPETQTIRYAMGADVPNRAFDVRAAIRSMQGGAATSPPYTLLISRPARYILPLPAVRGTGGNVVCRVKVLDALGQSVADGMRVAATSTTGMISVNGACRNGIVALEVPDESTRDPFIIDARGICDTVFFDTSVPEGSLPVAIVDASTGDGVPFPQAIAEGQGVARGDARGLLHVPGEWLGIPLIVTAKGYRPGRCGPIAPSTEAREMGDHLVRLSPILYGLLEGKRIALDAGGGGNDHGGMGRQKLRGASINLDVAKRVRDMLTRGGAVVTLTRTGEETLGAEERVQRVNGSRAELAIGIHHGTISDAQCSVLHYPGSARGRLLADSLCATLRELPPCADYSAGESAAAFLQQTRCPACEIHAGPVDEASNESVFANPRYVQLVAERIVSAVIGYLGHPGNVWIERTVTVRREGRPVPGAAVCIDQMVSVTADSQGRARFTRIDPGRHALIVEAPGLQSHGIHFVDFLAEGPDTLTVELAP